MLNFAGVDIPDFVKVTSITYSILPPVYHKAFDIAGRAGSYDYGVDLGSRKIEAYVQIIGVDQHDVIKKARIFAEWLFHEDLQPLIIADEPDKKYMARVVGDTDISEIFRVGQGKIEFTCPNTFAESLTEKTYTFSPDDESDIMQVTNNGSYKTYPVIELNVKEDTTSLAVISNDKYIQLGEPESVEKTNTVVNPRILWDEMTTTNGWSSGIDVDGGVVDGSFTSNGYKFTASYGSGTYWHGAAAIKALPKELTDFEVTVQAIHDASHAKQLGRVELYLLDANNSHIGKVAIVDSTESGDHARVEARAGNLSTGYYFVRDYGAYKGVFQNFNEGILRIGRKGNKWYAYFCIIDSQTGRHHTRLYREWIDYKNQYTSPKLAKIQIHIGAYGNKEPVSNMAITDVKVVELTSTPDPDTYNAIRLKQGDKITIDNDKAIVLLNGEPAFYLLDPASEFFALDKGINGLILSPAKADVTVKFTERWL